jgi:uncharacterized protein with von Willebrand factor type A (vWA) domain
MDRKLTEFVALLRRNGIMASPAETADAAAVLERVGFASRERFALGMGMALAKSLPDKAIFARCFEQFFTFSDFEDTAAQPGDPFTMPDDAASGSNGPLSGGGGEGSSGQPDSTLAEALLNNDQVQLQVAMAEAVDAAQLRNITVITQKGLYARRILMQMGLAGLEAEITVLEGSSSRASQLRAQALRAGRDRLRAEVREAVERYFLLARRRIGDETVREVSLNALNDFRDVKGVIQRMARRLITIHSRRKKQTRRGVLDLRHTLRRNVGYDGLIMEPQWRKRKKDRPKVIAVCDVSRSVSQYARFLLMFLYSLQEIIPRVRAFAFSTSLGEVTSLFETLEIDEALDAVMETWGMGSTDYGRALLDLEALALRDIDHNTTVIILGDARNNNGNARVEKLKLIHARAKQVIWINPENANRWGSGDSEMLRYKAHCTRVVSCGNLAQLERAVDLMLRTA